MSYGYMANLPLQDGKKLRVVGRLKQNTWIEESVQHSEVLIVAEHFEIIKRGVANGKAD